MYKQLTGRSTVHLISDTIHKYELTKKTTIYVLCRNNISYNKYQLKQVIAIHIFIYSYFYYY